jgi:two-component system sensor histidine kinase VanS
MSAADRRFTLRARLAVAFATLVSVTGALMLGGVYLFMRYVPSYALGPVVDLGLPSQLMTEDDTSTQPVSPLTNATGIGALAPVVSDTNDVFTLLLWVSLGVFVLLAAGGALAGWIIAGRMLRPLQAINRVAKSAASGDLNQRIASAGPHDELHDLADTLDDMLARLERSVGEHQRFAGNASHELRTPIATTQTLLDVALTDPELDLPTLRKTAERVREMNQRNREIVEALLALSDAEGGQLRRETIRLDELVSAAIEQEKPASVERGLTIQLATAPTTICGDPILLRQAVGNLVQNAVRHNVENGWITVIVDSTDNRARVRIANNGAVLAEDVIGTLTEPFVRGEGRVSGSRRGHGLGLTLANRVIEVHRGVLTVGPNDGGGLVVECSLPVSPNHPTSANS